MKYTSKHKLVLIEWEDSGAGYQGWKPVQSVSGSLTKCVSVGFLIKETKECKVLFPHIDGDENDLHGAGDMTIPCSAITKVVELVPKSK
jgi:hypothetical protein